MKLNGPWNGIDNQTYHAAYRFFKDREAKGNTTATKKRKSNDGAAVDTGNSKSSAGSKKDAIANVSDTHLDGEEDDKVEVYDTPAESRKKISAHLRKDGVTQAAFCREIGAQYHPARSVTSTQLGTFRKHSGSDKGNTNVVYYGAYVYLEKLRVKEGKAKSKHRQDMEKIWASEGGFNTTRPGPSTRR